MVKNLPAIQETHVRSLGQEDPLQKGMATHPNVLAWEISRTEEPGGLQFMGSQRVGHNFFRKILRISQVRILEWVSMPSFRGSSQPRDRTRIS